MRAILVLCVLCATAAAEPWPVQMPAGWTEHRDLAEAQIGKMRGAPAMKQVDVTIYLSPTNDAQLTLMNLVVNLDDASKGQIEAFDGGFTKGAAQNADRHIADSRHQQGNRIFSTSVDEVNGMRIHYERIYAVDSHDLIHVAGAVCAAPAASIGPCEDIQKTLHLDLADAANIKGDEDLAYKIGYALGGIAVMAVLIGLIRRFR